MYLVDQSSNDEAYIDLLEKEINADKIKGFDLELFNPDFFKKNASIVIAKLEEYLADSSIKGLALTDPTELITAAKSLMTSAQDEITPFDEKKLTAIIDLYVRTGIQVHSPGYMGRQFSGVVPLAGIFDMVNSILNQPSSFYEAAQLPNAVEDIMANELNQFIGWPQNEFAMVTTSGGSLANLTALLAARNDKYPHFWSKGATSVNQDLRPAIAVSEDAHYSVSRAAGIMGIGENQLVKLPVNTQKQIDITQVVPTIEDAKKRGLDVFCLVASVGTTATGAFDDIDTLGEIAQALNVWLHIDGAHGASLLVSDKLRHKLKGIEKVDSFSWDAHKMMFVPGMCTLLFYKDKYKSYGAFQQNASYVFEQSKDKYTQYDSAEQNFECTKRPLIMNLWVLWAIHGKALFAQKIEHLCHLTQEAYHLLSHELDFTPVHVPESNILCFKYTPFNSDINHIKDFQLQIRNAIKEDGTFFISKVDINQETCLRLVFMNHTIDMHHVRQLLQKIRGIGQQIIHQH